VSCGEAHSRARELVERGYQATLVAAALAISRSSLYYRKRARGSRADRQGDEQIVAACGAKPAYGYRRVSWWLRRKEGLVVNRKRVLRVMRERDLLVRSRRLRACRRKEWGRVETQRPNQVWQADLTKVWAGPAVGWAYLVSVIDCHTREGWNLSAQAAYWPKVKDGGKAMTDKQWAVGMELVCHRHDHKEVLRLAGELADEILGRRSIGDYPKRPTPAEGIKARVLHPAPYEWGSICDKARALKRALGGKDQ